MGLIWNSPATIAMLNLVNDEFSSDARKKGKDGDRPPMKKWKRQRNKELFIGRHELGDIARDNGFFGDDTPGSAADDRWQCWLRMLGDSSQDSSPHEILRAALYDGIHKYDDIVVTLTPWSEPFVAILPSMAGKTKTIQIYTPTVAAMKAAIKKRAAIRKKWRKRRK